MMSKMFKCGKGRNFHVAAYGCAVSLLAVVVPILMGSSGDPGTRDKEKAKYVVGEAIAVVASVGVIARHPTPKKEKVTDIYSRLKDISARSGPDFSISLLLYQAECLVLLGREKEFLQVAERAAKRGIDTPDFLRFHIYIVGEGKKGKAKTRIKIWDKYGRIVPISLYGSDRDDRGAPAGLIDPPPPSVPILSNIGTGLAEIGALYEKMGFEREAINSYLEALYASPFAETAEKRGTLWLKIAKIEAQQGQKALALRAYLKAAYCHKKYAKPAIKGIERIINEPKEGKKPATTPAVGKRPATKPTLDKKTVLRIVTLYRKLNLHPLALSLIVRTEKATGNKLSKEKEAIRKEWQNIVKRIVRIRGPNCYILGHKVSEVKDWAHIHVLRPSDTYWKPEISNNPQPSNKK